MRALADEIYKQAVHEVDRDGRIAEEFQLYRDNLAGVMAQHLGAGTSDREGWRARGSHRDAGRTRAHRLGLKHGDPLFSREELLKRYFGPMVDDLVAKYQVRIDVGTRSASERCRAVRPGLC